MEDITRVTVMEVNLNNFEYNINQIRNIIGNNVELMPVIKANGYGTWINRCLDIINKFNIVAVATVDEGVYLRNLGYEKEIFVLNQAYKTEIEKIIKYNITVGISSNSFLEELGKRDEKIKVHIEVGTGMGRTGVHPYKISSYIEKLPKNVFVEGIYTHLSAADIDEEYTRKQLKSFNHAVEEAKQILGEIKYIHSAASNAILNFPDSHFNLVRPGIIMYGYEACDTTFKKIDLKPIAKLKSKITFLKDVEAGTSIGYGRSFITKKHMKIATIPIGYADGLRRTFSNGWNVLIDNKKVPIIGKICMDNFMADVSEIDNVNIGDDVFIWDNENITVEDLANRCDTINYEILCGVSERVPRIFVND